MKIIIINFYHRHTLKLVLRGEWPKLQNATKTHLSVTLKRCAENLENHLASRCTTLVDLVHNPWSNPALEKILNGQPDGENEEGNLLSYLEFKKKMFIQYL